MIDLYSWGTPNGWKISIALEELQLEYKLHPVDLIAGAQHKHEFLALNPNSRIPVIVDRAADGLTLFESGAILIYLAEKTGQLLPSDLHRRSEVLQWLMLQMSGVGPMMGQAGIFKHFFPARVPSVISRFENESRRLMSVLNGRLKDREYLCGEFSIADIATWPWVRTHDMIDIDLGELPHLARWKSTLAERPACRRGLEVPPFRPPPQRDGPRSAALAVT